jgi:hypothetical protein
VLQDFLDLRLGLAALEVRSLFLFCFLRWLVALVGCFLGFFVGGGEGGA